MQSHKRPHELSDIFLKNLISATSVLSNLQSTSVLISEAAIIQRAVLLSSNHFEALFNSLNCVRKPRSTAMNSTLKRLVVNQLINQSAKFQIHQAINSSLTLIAKNPTSRADRVFLNKCLTMTYSHMGIPHTTIGDESFHY